MPKKIAIIVGYGQSNEFGTAITVKTRAMTQFGRAGSFGGVSRSAFGVLARILQNEGHAVWERNFSVGGTGVLDYWTGFIHAWAANKAYHRGSWVLPAVPNGFKYRQSASPALAVGAAILTSGSTEPTWPTSANATVVDGAITWTAVVAQPQDVLGRAAVFGDTAYDTNGLIAPFIAAIADAKAKGFEVWVCSTGHQSDIGYPKAQVTQALANLMRRAVTAGADRVYLGVTNRNWNGNSPSTAWDNPGTPDATLMTNVHDLRNLVLAALADQPKVLVGPDLSDIQMFQTDLEPPNTRIHMNDVGVLWAGKKWRDAIAASGGV